MKLSKTELAALIFMSLLILITVAVVCLRSSATQAVTVSLTQLVSPAPSGTAEGQDAALLVDINTADENALCALPGIGQTLAARIIAYREQIGGFKSIEEIMDVPGIGSGKFEKIKNGITVSAEG